MILVKFYRDELDIYNILWDLISLYKDIFLIYRYLVYSIIYICLVFG